VSYGIPSPLPGVIPACINAPHPSAVMAGGVPAPQNTPARRPEQDESPGPSCPPKAKTNKVGGPGKPRQ
jgi:hypothetical protein